MILIFEFANPKLQEIETSITLGCRSCINAHQLQSCLVMCIEIYNMVGKVFVLAKLCV